MIKFSQPSEEFKRLNSHIFGSSVQKTKGEAETKEDLRREKDLQVQILNLLNQRGIQPLWHRTDKKSTATVGWPDITFAVEQGLRNVPCVWEIKLPGKKLSVEQQSVMVKLLSPPNAWTYKVICSVDEALAELTRLGIGKS